MKAPRNHARTNRQLALRWLYINPPSPLSLFLNTEISQLTQLNYNKAPLHTASMRAHLKRSLYGLRANPCGIRCWFPDMFGPIIFSRHYPEREAVLHFSVPHSSKLSTFGPEEPISTLAGGVDEFIT